MHDPSQIGFDPFGNARPQSASLARLHQSLSHDQTIATAPVLDKFDNNGLFDAMAYPGQDTLGSYEGGQGSSAHTSWDPSNFDTDTTATSTALLAAAVPVLPALSDPLNCSETSTVSEAIHLSSEQFAHTNKEDGDAKRTQPALICNHHGCKNKKPFNRNADLLRHMRGHTRAVLTCPVALCNREALRKGPFSRLDKMLSHIRIVHGEDDPYPCPVQSCRFPGSSLSQVRSHLSACHPTRGIVPYSWEQLLYDYRTMCPLQGCRKALDCRNSVEDTHVKKSHSSEQRRRQQAALSDAGYDAETGDLRCPLCHRLFNSRNGIDSHLFLVHLTHTGHVEMWFRHLSQLFNRLGHEACLPENLFSTNHFYRAGLRSLNADVVGTKCPMCGHQASVSDELHPQLFIQSEEIEKNKEVILKLCPLARNHPMYKNLHRQ